MLFQRVTEPAVRLYRPQRAHGKNRCVRVDLDRHHHLWCFGHSLMAFFIAAVTFPQGTPPSPLAGMVVSLLGSASSRLIHATENSHRFFAKWRRSLMPAGSGRYSRISNSRLRIRLRHMRGRSLCPESGFEEACVRGLAPIPYGPKIENASSARGGDHASSRRPIVIVQHPTEPFAAVNRA